MQYLADIIIAVALIFFTIAGVHKGLFKSIADFLGVIISAVLAAAFSTKISTMIFDTFVKTGLETRINTSLESTTESYAVFELFENLPSYVLALFERQGITEEALAASIKSSSDEACDVIMNTITPTLVMIINFFVIIILFILLVVVIKFIAKIIDGIFKLPLLAQLNELLGGVFGLLAGLMFVFFVISAVDFASLVVSSSITESIETALENSFLTKIIIDNNPFSSIFD